MFKKKELEKEYVIPIFVPHLGCPQACTFCNQVRISGQETTVKAKDVKQFTRTFVIVGEIEANPSEGKISNTCPIAQAVLGHGEGEIVDIEANVPYKVKITHIG